MECVCVRKDLRGTNLGNVKSVLDIKILAFLNVLAIPEKTYRSLFVSRKLIYLIECYGSWWLGDLV